MKTPFPLLGLALLFWGWQTGLWLPALIMVVLAEAASFVRLRFELTPSDFKRLSDLCALVLLGLLLYAFISQKSPRAFLLFLQWLPMAFFPVLVAQLFSSSGKVPLTALFLLARLNRPGRENKPAAAADLCYPFFGIVVLASSAANTRSSWFYGALFLLVVASLWFFRSKRYSPWLWSLLLIGSGSIGYLGQAGLHRLQAVIENKVTGWYAGRLQNTQDPYRISTAIGDLGKLKLSDQILFRVMLEKQESAPLLLRESSYNAYVDAEWFAFRSGFVPLNPESDQTSWKIAADLADGERLTITSPLPNGKGLLKLPAGAFRIEGLEVPTLLRNPYGAFKVEDGPGRIHYGVWFKSGVSAESPPNEADFRIPEKERLVLQTIAADLDLSGKPTLEILNRFKIYFLNNFSYSLDLRTAKSQATPLQVFLTQTRSGHCEYFASATVLLLRTAGLPARYATGYLVDEYSKWEKQFVVRSRHAHAWARVWYDNAWHDFDTTPPSWISREKATASFLQPLADFWAWLIFKFTGWWYAGHGRISGYWGWLLVPVFFLLAGKFKLRKRIRSWTKKEAEPSRTMIRPGLDSGFYLLEKKLADLGFPRTPSEPLSAWLRRITEAQPGFFFPKELQTILVLHYRYRFDPKGITAEERLELKSKVAAWLASFPRSSSGSHDSETEKAF
jgi:hypothetical protein